MAEVRVSVPERSGIRYPLSPQEYLMRHAVRLAICVVLGTLAMLAAIGASRPLLRTVTADPAQTAD